VEILTQAPVIAERLADWLNRHPEFENRLEKSGNLRFLTTDDHTYFSTVAREILGRPVRCESVHIDEWPR
jgi:glutamate racemase